MTSTKKLGLVISDGVGFRNFILSDFLSESRKTFDEVIIFSCLPAKVYDGLEQGCKIIELKPYREKFLTWFFRKGKEMAHLKKFAKGNAGIQRNLDVNVSKAKTARGFASRFLYLLIYFFHSERFIHLLERLQFATYSGDPIAEAYKSMLSENKVSLLFFTHQRPPFIAPLIAMAERLGIKTSTFIFSWDNLGSKGRMAGTFNGYLVWSELMKSELLHFYERITSDQVYPIGTPQFELYCLDRYAMTRESFIKRFGLNETHKLVCYSCGDISTSINDEHYIELIAEMILHNELPFPCDLLVRTSPAEDPDRFFYLKDRYPFIIWNYPQWEMENKNHPEPWSQRVPSVADMIDLRALLTYSDVNINVCSTMSLDSMIFDRPVVNPVLGNKTNSLFDDQQYLEFEHYKRVAESGSVFIARTRDELLEGIIESLSNPDKRKNERAAMFGLQVSKKLEGTSRRIAEALTVIA